MGNNLRILWTLLVFGVVWFLSGPKGGVVWLEENLELLTQLLVWAIIALVGLFVLAFVWAVISLRHRDKYDSGYPGGKGNKETALSK